MFLELELPPPFRAVVSTRAGGESPAPWDSQNHGTSTGDSAERVLRNARRLADALGPEGPGGPEGWALVSQVHGSLALEVGRPGRAGEADALWTGRTGPALGIRVADCSAVALAHPPTGRLGLAHAGWRGAAAGVTGALLRAMNVPATEVHAAISPHLGPCCFEVGPDVVAAFSGRFCAPRRGDRSSLDLGAALRSELSALGVPASRIRADGRCTSCARELFFSHRRDHGATGRMIVLGWSRPGRPPGGP
ncbi:MAG: laccase domain-containing protein [Candidatus Eisenbacteria bacterium]|nr:laccase domain-containing protein [Candidatus Eisenbacteria bacterium]